MPRPFRRHDDDQPNQAGDGQTSHTAMPGDDPRAGTGNADVPRTRADRLAGRLADIDRRLEAQAATIARLEARKRAMIARGAPDPRQARNYRLLLAGARAEARLGATSAGEIDAIADAVEARPEIARLFADALDALRDPGDRARG